MRIIQKVYPKNYICLLLAAALVGIDQLLKWLVTLSMQPFDSNVVLPGVLRITYVQNTGAAFNLFQGSTTFLVILTGLALCIAIFLIVSGRITKLSYLIPISMLIGGGVGNLLDRIFCGFVVDYIDISFWPFDSFAIFNFADCLVVIGTILLLVCLLKDEFQSRRGDRQADDNG